MKVFDRDIERKLHRQFAESHSHGEWFDECSEIFAICSGEDRRLDAKKVPEGVRDAVGWLSHWIGREVPDPPGNGFCDMTRAAEFLEVQLGAMRRAVDRGVIRPMMIGRTMRFSWPHIVKLIADTSGKP